MKISYEKKHYFYLHKIRYIWIEFNFWKLLWWKEYEMIIFFNFSSSSNYFEILLSKFSYQDCFISSIRGNSGAFQHWQTDHRIEVPRSPGNHACQLRARRRPMQFPYNQTANTDSLYVAPSQRTLVIPYANSMLQARARRARRSNQYCTRKVGCYVQPNNSRPYVCRNHQCAKKYVEK